MTLLKAPADGGPARETTLRMQPTSIGHIPGGGVPVMLPVNFRRPPMVNSAGTLPVTPHEYTVGAGVGTGVGRGVAFGVACGVGLAGSAAGLGLVGGVAAWELGVADGTSGVWLALASDGVGSSDGLELGLEPLVRVG